MKIRKLPDACPAHGCLVMGIYLQEENCKIMRFDHTISFSLWPLRGQRDGVGGGRVGSGVMPCEF